MKRRIRRSDRPKSDESFMLIGEQESQIYCLPQKNFPGVIVVDGKKTPQEIASEILSVIKDK